MKTIIKSTLFIGLIALLFTACKPEELRVHYPESMPEFKKAEVEESAIVYGDSISLSVEVADPLTPLSTLEVMIVVGDEIVTKESVRTKGNESIFTKKYAIPFVARMPEGATVEVHLTSINVEGTKNNKLIEKTIATRPNIPHLYLATATKTVKLELIDEKNFIYEASGLTFDNEISFRLGTIVNRFNKIDYNDPNNIVFGWMNGSLNLVEIEREGSVVSVTGEEIVLSNPKLVGYNKITVDLFNFTVKGDGDELKPATLLEISKLTTKNMTSVDHMNTVLKEDWKTGVMYLGEDTEMEITGVTDVANCLDPTFFEPTSGNKAKFLGPTGIYTVYYLPRLDYVFVEQPTAVYPDALWLVGVGMGPARTPGVKTSSWNWNSPLEYKFCRKVSDGVFETIFFANHEVDEDAKEPWRLTFGVKFMHQRTWGDEESSDNYEKPANGFLYSPSPNDVGNFNATAAFANQPGIYRFVIDVNNKTTIFEKIK